MTCVFNETNKERNSKDSKGKANPNTWHDPTLREAENYATSASGAMHYPPPFLWDNHLGVTVYQFIWKPLQSKTTAVSTDAYLAGLDGISWHGLSAAEVTKDAASWCDCTK